MTASKFRIKTRIFILVIVRKKNWMTAMVSFQKLHLKYFYYKSSFVAFGPEVLWPFQEYL